MIRLLTEADRQATLEFLAAESAFNLFILADIHNYGFEAEFQMFYDNPEAGAIYKRLGFRDIGRWEMVPQREGATVSPAAPAAP